MEKQFYTHDHTNDTTYLFERDADGHGRITMTFTSEDPNYGTEELIYGGDGTEHELCCNLQSEITECLDLQEQGRCGYMPEHLKYYDEGFVRTSLIAFEAMLITMAEGETK